MVSRHTNLRGDRFDIHLQESEQNLSGGHANEEVGYIAMEQGAGATGHVANTGARVDHHWRNVRFDTKVDDPVLMATDQTFNGGNTGSIRFNNLSSGSAHLRFQEETTRDDETRHADVNAGVAALESGKLHAAPVIGEADTIKVHQTGNDQWHNVALKKTYDDPVVVMGPVGPHGGQPAMTRVKEVGGSNFKLIFNSSFRTSGEHCPISP